jgi:hypothetical protein
MVAGEGTQNDLKTIMAQIRIGLKKIGVVC